MSGNNYNTTELVLATLYKDEDGLYKGQYFLRLEYKYEDESGIYRKIYPKVSMNIPKDRLPYIEGNIISDICCTNQPILKEQYLRLGSGQCHRLLPDKNKNFEYTILIEPKVHELTVEEIEKILGYKVKIIKRKENSHKKQSL